MQFFRFAFSLDLRNYPRFAELLHARDESSESDKCTKKTLC